MAWSEMIVVYDLKSIVDFLYKSIQFERTLSSLKVYSKTKIKICIVQLIHSTTYIEKFEASISFIFKK